MGKNKEKKRVYHDANDILSLVSAKVNKKGEIKGDSKKETRMLRYACPHHKLSKKGNRKPTIDKPDGSKYLICYMCGAKFTGQLLNDQELANALKKPKDIIQQMKYLATAVGVDKDASRFITQAAIDIYSLEKYYRNMRKKVDNDNKLKKKKKNNSGNERLGGWRMNTGA